MYEPHRKTKENSLKYTSSFTEANSTVLNEERPLKCFFKNGKKNNASDTVDLYSVDSTEGKGMPIFIFPN